MGGSLGLDFLPINGCKNWFRQYSDGKGWSQKTTDVYLVTDKDKTSIVQWSEVVIFQGEVLSYDLAVKVNGIFEPSEERLCNVW